MTGTELSTDRGLARALCPLVVPLGMQLLEKVQGWEVVLLSDSFPECICFGFAIIIFIFGDGRIEK